LNGRAALVVGAGSGIGEAMAVAFASVPSSPARTNPLRARQGRKILTAGVPGRLERRRLQLRFMWKRRGEFRAPRIS